MDRHCWFAVSFCLSIILCVFALCIFNGDLGAAAAGAAVIDRPINRSAVAAAFHNIDALCTNVMIVFVISVCLFFF